MTNLIGQIPLYKQVYVAHIVSTQAVSTSSDQAVPTGPHTSSDQAVPKQSVHRQIKQYLQGHIVSTQAVSTSSDQAVPTGPHTSSDQAVPKQSVHRQIKQYPQGHIVRSSSTQATTATGKQNVPPGLFCFVLFLVYCICFLAHLH